MSDLEQWISPEEAAFLRCELAKAHRKLASLPVLEIVPYKVDIMCPHCSGPIGVSVPAEYITTLQGGKR